MRGYAGKPANKKKVSGKRPKDRTVDHLRGLGRYFREMRKRKERAEAQWEERKKRAASPSYKKEAELRENKERAEARYRGYKKRLVVPPLDPDKTTDKERKAALLEKKDALRRKKQADRRRKRALEDYSKAKLWSK